MAEVKEHIAAPRMYIGVLIALMILLVATIITAFIDLDAWTTAHHLGAGWNTVVALLIAMLKAALIALFFMHLKYASRLTWVFASAGVVWLGIMLTLTMSDYFTRNHPPGVNAKGEPNYIVEPAPPGHPSPRIDNYPGQPGSYH
ncbi:MAG TPA: cytochrome C oxidase subunit IV family protein [Tepidisphaeraceae bacterium]|jgi:cytochrome c oxidase subunit 4|nr:cytochrome C oxidase subunit IV family protein [Tepidisphaeraceae bacterium]